jgi:hypothetical protein
LEWHYDGPLAAAVGWMVSAALPEETPGLFWDQGCICVEPNNAVETVIRIAAAT